MNKGVSVCLVAWMIVVASVASRGQTPGQTPGPTPTPHGALINRYCVTCHNQRAKTGGLALDTMSLTNIPAGAETWEKVIRKVRGGQMPPVRHAATAAGSARRPGGAPGILNRQGGAGSPDTAARRHSSPEPLRVRQRHPRSLRARRRCLRAPASGRGSVRVRQQRDGAQHLDVADGAIPLGRVEDQQPRRREPEDHAVARDLPRARRSLAARPRAWPPGRHARRHRDPPLLPGGRRLRRSARGSIAKRSTSSAASSSRTISKSPSTASASSWRGSAARRTNRRTTCSRRWPATRWRSASRSA